MPNTSLVAPTPAAVGSPSVGPAPVQVQGQGYIPFRLATIERSEVIGTTALTPGAAEQISDNPIPGTGYMYGLHLQVNAPASGNAATVAYNEDAPYNALSSVLLSDVTGQIDNLDGWSLKQISRYGGWEPFNEEGSADTNIWQKVTGSGGTGGTFNFHVRVPVALNRRDLIGILGNQDRAQQYTLRHNVAPSATIYSTPPTAIPLTTITRTYDSYAVPNLSNEQGTANQASPNTYGVINYLTKTTSEALPAPGQITHFVRRIGNSMRDLMLVWRQGATPTRANAEANLPTNIQFKLGDQVLFNETVASRRCKMFDRTGFDAPQGTLVYEWIHDFDNTMGFELGNDILWTENLTQMQLLVTYPAGFAANAANSLTFVTSDMIVPAGTDIYNP